MGLVCRGIQFLINRGGHFSGLGVGGPLTEISISQYISFPPPSPSTIRVVSEQKKTEELSLRFWLREKWNESPGHFLRSR